jgi:hypothetical protein
MLNLARQTLKRVPSFQELLQGRMAKEEMYAPHRRLRPLQNTAEKLTAASTCSSLELARQVSELRRG